MANRQNIDELMNEAMAVWSHEGMDSTDADSPLYNLHTDPVTKLLLGALNYRSNAISDDISSLKDDLADECLNLSAPDYLFSPLPSLGMIQTAKKHFVGKKNREKTFLDCDFSFEIHKEVGPQRLSIPFIPILSTAVMDYSLRSVKKVDKCRWRLEIEDLESAASLEGLSFYLPNIEHLVREDVVYDRANLVDSNITLYVGDCPIPVSNVCDFDRLPFTDFFLKGLYFSKNAMQCAILQSIHDLLSAKVSCYCVVEKYDMPVSIPTKDGCFFIDIEIPALDPNANLTVDDILLNCVPVVNVQKNTQQLSLSNPVQKINIEKGFFLTTILNDGSETSPFVVRKVGTSRISPQQWMRRMTNLLDQYNAHYSVMDQLLDEKLKRTMQPFIAALKQNISEQRVSADDSLYLVLKNKMSQSVSACWLSTLGSAANGLDSDDAFEVCSSAEIDTEKTRLVGTTSGGRDPINDIEHKRKAMRYYQVSRDRIVSKYDIILFCRTKLFSMFAVSSSDIVEMRIDNSKRNSSEGFYERILVISITLRKGIVNSFKAARALECMIKSRSASSIHVKVMILEAKKLFVNP